MKTHEEVGRRLEEAGRHPLPHHESSLFLLTLQHYRPDLYD